MACSDLDQPDVAIAAPVSQDWIRWIRLASARQVQPCREEPAARPAPRFLTALRTAGGPKLR